MDGSAYFFIFLVCAASAMPMMEENSEEPAPNTTVADAVSSPSLVTEPTTVTSTEITAESSENCTTSRNLVGRCITRASCEHSTAAIDFTLYAPHGYIKTCKAEEVCCPLEYIIVELAETTINQSTQSVNNDNDNAFEFDDDD